MKKGWLTKHTLRSDWEPAPTGAEWFMLLDTAGDPMAGVVRWAGSGEWIWLSPWLDDCDSCDTKEAAMAAARAALVRAGAGEMDGARDIVVGDRSFTLVWAESTVQGDLADERRGHAQLTGDREAIEWLADREPTNITVGSNVLSDVDWYSAQNDGNDWWVHCSWGSERAQQ
jgi:hypothetical protein